MIALERVRATVESRWANGFMLVPTSYAGTTLDDDARPAWAELWVTSSDVRPRRSSGPDRVEITVTAHLFVRDPSQPRLAEKLVDAARAVLDQATWTSDRERISLHELTTRDLSRVASAAGPQVLRHVVVIAGGVAEEVCPAATT